MASPPSFYTSVSYILSDGIEKSHCSKPVVALNSRKRKTFRYRSFPKRGGSEIFQELNWVPQAMTTVKISCLPCRVRTRLYLDQGCITLYVHVKAFERPVVCLNLNIIQSWVKGLWMSWICAKWSHFCLFLENKIKWRFKVLLTDYVIL